jgi:hypothetical protein
MLLSQAGGSEAVVLAYDTRVHGNLICPIIADGVKSLAAASGPRNVGC